ncbi:hypothetical protein SBV1_910002 [Verrucomicrobia bacterium]|nr:hypothetical protein SBV1_910002 [Verrucomicrobiota bacterium]
MRSGSNVWAWTKKDACACRVEPPWPSAISKWAVGARAARASVSPTGRVTLSPVNHGASAPNRAAKSDAASLAAAVAVVVAVVAVVEEIEAIAAADANGVPTRANGRALAPPLAHRGLGRGRLVPAVPTAILRV